MLPRLSPMCVTSGRRFPRSGLHFPASIWLAVLVISPVFSKENPYEGLYRNAIRRMSESDTFSNQEVPHLPDAWNQLLAVAPDSKACSTRCSTACSKSCQTTNGCSSQCKVQADGCGSTSNRSKGIGPIPPSERIRTGSARRQTESTPNSTFGDDGLKPVVQNPAASMPFTGTVVKVLTGDTLLVRIEGDQEVVVALTHIDAPKDGQEFAEQAKQVLSSLVHGKVVSITFPRADKEGKVFAHVFLGELWINQTMLLDGMAWYYDTFPANPYLRRLQLEAKSATKGLWQQADPVAPWEYRMVVERVEKE